MILVFFFSYYSLREREIEKGRVLSMKGEVNFEQDIVYAEKVERILDLLEDDLGEGDHNKDDKGVKSQTVAQKDDKPSAHLATKLNHLPNDVQQALSSKMNNKSIIDYFLEDLHTSDISVGQ